MTSGSIPPADDVSADNTDVAAVVADERRVVRLDSVHNFRDLGGYPTAAGGRTRWGLVFRADGLHHLTPGDLEALRNRGLGIVIDLRTDAELAERGRFPIERHPVQFHHLPVLDRTWTPGEVPQFDDAHGFLMWAYHDMLTVGADELAAGLDIISAAGDTPLVFHCAAGKDRTGLLAALLLAVLGVPAPYVAADYAKTAEAMQRMREAWTAAAAKRPRDDDGGRARADDGRSHYFESPAAVMLELLDELASTHGSVVDYVRSLGVTTATIEALRRRLLDPTA